MNLRERLAGFAVMTLLVPMAIVGYLFLVYLGFLGRTERGRAGVRALDHFVNATLFNGLAWESVSSHAWRERHNKRWARAVITVMDMAQDNHCQRSNKREQAVVDLIKQKGLDKQTIF